jgi:hypothetical protein
MNLSAREKIIALFTAIVVVFVVGYLFLIAPYLANRAQLAEDIKSTQSQYDDETKLLAAQPRVAADWKSLLAGNLKTIPAQASGKTQDALYDWARSARFNLQSVKPDRPRQDKDFQQIRFQASGAGTTASIYRFLAAIEKSDLPLKIEELRVNSRKDGTDDLNITLTLSALIFSPPAPGARSAPTQPAGGTL